MSVYTIVYISFSFCFLFFLEGRCVLGSKFPDQGLNLGHGSESTVSQPLGHQGISSFGICFPVCIFMRVALLVNMHMRVS